MGPGGRLWEDFHDSGRAGNINNSISMPNYCDERYGDLGMYVNEVLSAWTEVWIGA